MDRKKQAVQRNQRNLDERSTNYRGRNNDNVFSQNNDSNQNNAPVRNRTVHTYKIKSETTVDIPMNKTRCRGPLEDIQINRTRSVTMNQAHRPYHNNYDPNIELRQVSERIAKRNSKTWSDLSELEDEEKNDLHRYMSKNIDKIPHYKLETNEQILSRRQGEIDRGKSQPCYQKYVYSISKKNRKMYMPKTPNKFIKMSRRCWDGLTKKWKKHIHAYDLENFDELYKAGFTVDCCKSETSSVSSLRDILTDHSDEGSISDVNRLDDVQDVDDDDDDDDGTMQGTRMSTRKRPNTETVDESTLEAYPTSSDRHTGLTQDAFKMAITFKRQKRVN